MTMPTQMNRRDFFNKLGLAFNGLVALMMGVPIFRFMMSPVTKRRGGEQSWLSLGSTEQFPEGETRLATYRNPVVTATDGDTAKVACWVRRTDAEQFQVFAVNCAHLGCPVRWFPQSNLFMCPCHGGAYYADGRRASGPPERGLFEHEYRIVSGELQIRAGEMPTPGTVAGRIIPVGKDGRPPCA